MARGQITTGFSEASLGSISGALTRVLWPGRSTQEDGPATALLRTLGGV